MAKAQKETLTSNQERGIELMFAGWKQKDIAKELGISEVAVCRWKHSESFNKAKEKYAKEQLGGLIPKAIQTMEKLLNAKSELVRYNAASDILDRAGLKAPDENKLEVVNPITIVDDIK